MGFREPETFPGNLGFGMVCISVLEISVEHICQGICLEHLRKRGAKRWRKSHKQIVRLYIFGRIWIMLFDMFHHDSLPSKMS